MVVGHLPILMFMLNFIMAVNKIGFSSATYSFKVDNSFTANHPLMFNQPSRVDHSLIGLNHEYFAECLYC